VKVYLFSLLSELEVHLGSFITEHVAEDKLLNMTFGDKEDEQHKEKHDVLKQRHQEDKAKGLDLPFIEYLYLSDMISVITKQGLYQKLRYSRSRFTEHFGSLNDLRNKVAHPNRSIVTDEDSAKKLWRRIDRIEEALFILG